MDGAENRRSRRRALHFPAWVSLETKELVPCQIGDIADRGARLAFGDDADPAALPDAFVLLFSPGGHPRRLCQVVWREDRQVGVKFVSPDRSAAHKPKPTSLDC
jgi:hypothetical protein